MDRNRIDKPKVEWYTMGISYTTLSVIQSMDILISWLPLSPRAKATFVLANWEVSLLNSVDTYASRALLLPQWIGSNTRKTFATLPNIRISTNHSKEHGRWNHGIPMLRWTPAANHAKIWSLTTLLSFYSFWSFLFPVNKLYYQSIKSSWCLFKITFVDNSLLCLLFTKKQQMD